MRGPREREDQRLQVFLGLSASKVACESGDEKEISTGVPVKAPMRINAYLLVSMGRSKQGGTTSRSFLVLDGEGLFSMPSK